MKKTTKLDGRPSFQFYPDKWMTDTGLRLCSLAAKGLWMDMLCVMWHSPIRGELRQANGKQIQADDLSKLVAEPQAEVKQALADLEAHNVYSTLEDGTIYNRRMRREWEISRSKALAGRLGGLKRAEQAKGASTTTSSTSSAASTAATQTETALARSQKQPVSVPEILKGLTLYEADEKLCEKLTPDVLAAWAKAYPGVDIPAKIAAAHAWEVSNPARAKKNRLRFLGNWMANAQDKPRTPSASPLHSGEHDNLFDKHRHYKDLN